MIHSLSRPSCLALLAVALLFALGSCASTPTVPDGEVVGEPVEPRAVVTFATVDANPPAYFEQTLLVEAQVVAVCQKAGCWMQIEDQGRRAMVRWETGCGGKYVFPPDLVGRRVLVQGSFYPKTISEEDAEHIEEEAGPGVAIDREGYEFNASAVVVLAEA